MASSSALVALLVVLGCAAAASAETFTVGDGQGWTTGFDYTGWTSGKNFSAGDKLVFTYPSQAHTVTEVSKSDYDACTSSNKLSNDNSGSTTLTLTAGTHYYICTVGSHCSSGMKLAVTAAGSSSGTPGTPPTTPATNTPTGASARLQAVPVVAAAAAAALIKLALF